MLLPAIASIATPSGIFYSSSSRTRAKWSNSDRTYRRIQNVILIIVRIVLVESVWLEVSVNFVSLVNDGRIDFKLKLSETYPT